MSIQTTITRKRAIERITKVHHAIESKDYGTLKVITFDPGADMPDIDISDIENWSNERLEDVMNMPFYRQALFDSYKVS